MELRPFAGNNYIRSNSCVALRSRSTSENLRLYRTCSILRVSGKKQPAINFEVLVCLGFA